MKTLKFKTIFSLLILTALTGCGMSAKFNEEKAKSVKRVAILSLEIHQEQPKDALGLGGLAQMKKGLRVSDTPEIKLMAAEIYQLAAKNLEDTTGWNVAKLENLKKSDSYSKIYQEKMVGLRGTSWRGSGTDEIIFPDGVLDNHNFRKLSPAEKSQLAKKMGADAYAEITVFQTIDQGWSIGNLTGNAPFAFKSRSNIMVFGVNSEEPIWVRQNVDGETSKNSTELGEAPKMVKLAKLGKESAALSLKKLTETYPGKK